MGTNMLDIEWAKKDQHLKNHKTEQPIEGLMGLDKEGKSKLIYS